MQHRFVAHFQPRNPMKFSFLLMVTAAALTVAACKKSETRAPASSGGEAATSETPPPRRNTAESLGFASEADYFSPTPSAPAAAQPAPPKGTTASAPVARSLTATDGRSVDALLLSRTETAVRIRRKADAAEFTIPLEKLSAADRKFIEGGAVPLEGGR